MRYSGSKIKSRAAKQLIDFRPLPLAILASILLSTEEMVVSGLVEHFCLRGAALSEHRGTIAVRHLRGCAQRVAERE